MTTKYKLCRPIEITPGNFVESKVVIDLESGKIIPKDTNNRDYQQYLKWIESGNTPEAANQDE